MNETPPKEPVRRSAQRRPSQAGKTEGGSASTSDAGGWRGLVSQIVQQKGWWPDAGSRKGGGRIEPSAPATPAPQRSQNAAEQHEAPSADAARAAPMAIESASAQAVADAPSLSRPEISNLTIPKLEELESAFESARIRSRDGKPDEAVPDLRQLAHRASTAPSIIVQIAAVLREIGQYDEAEALLQQAAQSHPSDRGIAAAFASLAFQRGAWQEAVARFRRYVETFSEDPVGYARLSQAELQLGPLHVREAEMALEKGLLRHAGDGELLSGYARLAESRGLWDEALARWSICARRLSLDPVGYVGMCFALFRLGRLGEAETCLARALVRFPTAPDLVSVQARVAFARQNWSEALMHWSRYSELRPGDAFADLQAKICHEKLAS